MLAVRREFVRGSDAERQPLAIMMSLEIKIVSILVLIHGL